MIFFVVLHHEPLCRVQNAVLLVCWNRDVRRCSQEAPVVVPQEEEGGLQARRLAQKETQRVSQEEASLQEVARNP